jgi:hypothetical protein
MKKFLSVVGLVVLTWAAVLAEGLPRLEDVFPDLPPGSGLPDTLEGDAPPGLEDRSGDGISPTGVAAEPPASLPSEEPEEKFVPALLRITKVKQYETACQYWLKLENRLPFSIRNMALHFSAYIMEEGYDNPVLFDVSTRSFSEMRPTDSQYRDIFFEHTRCDRLSFIKVEDAGRCAIGELTKFSSQSGDCSRYLEIQPSGVVCIYLDDGTLDLGLPDEGSQGRSLHNPCGMITQEQVDDLLERFITNYEAGDLEHFLALFDPAVTLNKGAGIDILRREYDRLFGTSTRREVTIHSRSWKPGRSGSAIIRFQARVDVDREGVWGSDSYLINGRLVALLREQDLVIASFTHEQVDESNYWPSPYL